jgi:hypothetical protein
MLKDVVNRIKKEIDDDKRLRESTESDVLNVLEETLNKILAAQE